MNTSKPIAGLFALTLAFAPVGSGRALAQSDQDHGAHHPAAAQTQTTPAAPASRGGRMPGMGGRGMPGGMSGMMGGTMQQMMRVMQMMREGIACEGMGGPMGMMRFDHIEGRIAFLRAELGITDAQQPQWNAFADALRAQAGSLQKMRDTMMPGGTQDTWPERLAREERFLSTRLDAVKAMTGAARALYAALSPEQQKKADELMGHPMGGM